ncbi:hypothetical protein [Actinoplanes sp. NPDC051494]|uniref:SCO6745 family protein n=1 Tax=Actinoplanes sp. NPDC051494 TaxID=3363907 RepID=UPI00379768D5
MSAQWARAFWAASEPFTVSMFFTPEAASITERAGLPGRAAYVVLRSAPLGAVPPAVAASAFRSFPAPVFAVLDNAWQRLTPQAAIDANHEAVLRAASPQIGDPPADLGDMADLLTEAVEHLDTSGRALAAANQSVPAQAEPWARLWRALNTLREHRGDGDVAALIAAGLAVHDSEVLMAAWAGKHTDSAMLRATRSIDDDSWRAASTRLFDRGLVDAEGEITAEAPALRNWVEQVTDKAAADPRRRIGEDRIAPIHQFLTTLSSTLIDAGQMPAVTPVGAPWPPPAPSGI